MSRATGRIQIARLTDWSETDFQLGPLLAPLEPFKDKMIVLDGQRVLRGGPGDGHQTGMGSLWTGSPLLDAGGSAGWASGISVDQHVANAVGGDTPYRSLEFGVKNGSATIGSRMSYAGSNAPVAPEDDPRAMFARLFANLGVDTSALDRLKAERRSVIDLVKDDLTALESKYGSSDRGKIDAHLQAIREMERRNDMAVPACEEPDQPGGSPATTTTFRASPARWSIRW